MLHDKSHQMNKNVAYNIQHAYFDLLFSIFVFALELGRQVA